MKSVQKPKALSVLLALLLSFVPFTYSTAVETLKPETAGLSSQSLTEIDNIFSQAVSGKRIKGAVAIVARNNKIAYIKAFGDRDEGKPMETDTIFRICSMTKPVTAVAVMKLWEQGRIKLDDPLYKFVPEFRDVKVLINDAGEKNGYRLEPAKRPITIRHLLTHTSGLSYGFFGRPVIAQSYLDNDIPDGFRTANGTIGEACKRLAKCPLVFQPGDDFEYGLSFDVLGHVVEVVSGMAFDRYLNENILKPLNMNDTYFFVPDNKVNRLAALYRPAQEGGLKKLETQVKEKGIFSPVESAVYDPFYSYKGPRKYFSGGAGLHSTAADYLQFCQMLLNKGELNGIRILKSETVEMMTENRIGEINLAFSKGEKYGFGVGIITDNSAGNSPLPNGSYYWMGIYNTSFYIDQKHNLIAATFCQLYPNMQVMDLILNFRTLTQKAIAK